MDTRHDDVAAYALGVLDREDAVAFEGHLAGCERCQLELGDFTGLTPMLREPAARAALAMSVRAPMCQAARSVLYVAAGFVVAIAAVLSVVEALAGGGVEPSRLTSVEAVSSQVTRLFGRV